MIRKGRTDRIGKIVKKVSDDKQRKIALHARISYRKHLKIYIIMTSTNLGLSNKSKRPSGRFSYALGKEEKP